MGGRKIVFWDIGGPQTNFDVDEFAERFARLFGTDTIRVLGAMYGDGEKSVFRRIEIDTLTPKEFHREMCRRLGRRVAFDTFTKEFNAPIKPLPNSATAMLVALKEMLVSEPGVTQGIMSNINALHLAHLSEEFKYVFAPTSFAFRYFSCELGVRKPEMFGRVFEEIVVPSKNCALIDDREENTREFTRCGGVGILFSDGYYKTAMALAEHGFLSQAALREYGSCFVK